MNHLNALGLDARTGRARSRPGGVRPLTLAAAAGLLRPRDLEGLPLGGDHVEDLADALAHRPQIAAAVRAAAASVECASLAVG